MNRTRYAGIPLTILADRRPTAAAKVIALGLSDLAREGPHLELDPQVLSETCGLSLRDTLDGLRSLERAGWVARAGGRSLRVLWLELGRRS